MRENIDSHYNKSRVIREKALTLRYIIKDRSASSLRNLLNRIGPIDPTTNREERLNQIEKSLLNGKEKIEHADDLLLFKIFGEAPIEARRDIASSSHSYGVSRTYKGLDYYDNLRDEEVTIPGYFKINNELMEILRHKQDKADTDN